MMNVGSSRCSMVGGKWSSSMISAWDVRCMIGGMVWWHISERLRSIVDGRWNELGWRSVRNDRRWNISSWSWNISSWSCYDWLNKFSRWSNISVRWSDISVGWRNIMSWSSENLSWCCSRSKISCRWCNKFGWFMSDNRLRSDDCWSNSSRFCDNSVESIYCISGLIGIKKSFSISTLESIGWKVKFKTYIINGSSGAIGFEQWILKRINVEIELNEEGREKLSFMNFLNWNQFIWMTQ